MRLQPKRWPFLPPNDHLFHSFQEKSHRCCPPGESNTAFKPCKTRYLEQHSSSSSSFSSSVILCQVYILFYGRLALSLGCCWNNILKVCSNTAVIIGAPNGHEAFPMIAITAARSFFFGGTIAANEACLWPYHTQEYYGGLLCTWALLL